MNQNFNLDASVYTVSSITNSASSINSSGAAEVTGAANASWGETEQLRGAQHVREDAAAGI